MNSRSICPPLVTLAAFAFAGFLSLAQATAQPPAPAPASPSAQAAPIERQAPANAPPGMDRRGMGQGMRPGMAQGHMRPGMQANPGANMMRNRANLRGGGFRGGPAGGFRGNQADGFRGGPGAGFHGPQAGSMGAGLRIGPGGTWWKNPTVVQRLSLTPEQAKKMDDIFQQSRIQLIDLKANIEKQSAMLEPLLSANPVDTAKASVQIDKVAQARADLEKADAKMLLGIRAVLTFDQWTKLHSRAGAPGQGGPGGPAAQNGYGDYGEGGYGRGHGPAGYGANDFVAPPPQP